MSNYLITTKGGEKMSELIGVLLMSYGTPRSSEEIVDYYTHIRKGREPNAEMIRELSDRYEAIGGSSPLLAISEKQRELLEQELNRIPLYNADYHFQVLLGYKHISPFIEDTVAQFFELGIKKIIAVVLAPHYSNLSVGEYLQRAKKKAEEFNIKLEKINYWYQEEAWNTYWQDRLKEIAGQITNFAKTIIIFSAHSLPKRILGMGDSYPEQIADNIAKIMESSPIKNYAFAWQSAGKSPEPWLTPTIEEVVTKKIEDGFINFIFAPIGFVSDHLEVLYDLDIEIARLIKELKLNYYRLPMPNSDLKLINSLKNAITKISLN